MSINLKIIDNSLLTAQKYILIEGNFYNSTSSAYAAGYLDITLSPSKVQFYDTTTTSVTALVLPPSSSGYMISLPDVIQSGRIWLSIGQPIVLQVTGSAAHPPSAELLQNENFYKIYDKIEISRVHGDNTIYMNPTAVDFFSIPLSISLIDTSGPTKTSGIPVSRIEALKIIENVLSNNIACTSLTPSITPYSTCRAHNDHCSPLAPLPMWESLILYYNMNNIGLSDKTGSFLRVIPPKLAYSANPQDALPVKDPFVKNYLSQNPYDFLEQLWHYYSIVGNVITVDTAEIIGAKDSTGTVSYTVLPSGGPADPTYYTFTGRVVAGELLFVNKDSSYKVTLSVTEPIENYDSTMIFGGIWSKAILPANCPDGIIIRQVTSAINVGVLPLVPAGESKITKSEFQSATNPHGPITKAMYYFNNKYFDSTAGELWYDLYAAAIHSIPGAQIYAFDYDDALGQDGTLTGPVASLNYAQIIIQNMSGTIVPDPKNDHVVYFSITLNSQDDITCLYTDSSHSSKTATITTGLTPPQTTVTLTNAIMPLHITYTNHKHTINFDIYLTHQFIDPYYDGIAFGITGDVPYINFGADM